MPLSEIEVPDGYCKSCASIMSEAGLDLQKLFAAKGTTEIKKEVVWLCPHCDSPSKK
jgi:alkyl hydroperoxide reductase subunit AhpF